MEWEGRENFFDFFWIRYGGKGAAAGLGVALGDWNGFEGEVSWGGFATVCFHPTPNTHASPSNLPCIESFALYPNIYTLDSKSSREGKFRANTRIPTSPYIWKVSKQKRPGNTKTRRTETAPESG